MVGPTLAACCCLLSATDFLSGAGLLGARSLAGVRMAEASVRVRTFMFLEGIFRSVMISFVFLVGLVHQHLSGDQCFLNVLET